MGQQPRNDEGLLSQKQRDYLLLHPEKAREVRKGVEKYGKEYDPDGDGGESWWPNKYPDM